MKKSVKQQIGKIIDKLTLEITIIISQETITTIMATIFLTMPISISIIIMIVIKIIEVTKIIMYLEVGCMILMKESLLNKIDYSNNNHQVIIEVAREEVETNKEVEEEKVLIQEEGEEEELVGVQVTLTDSPIEINIKTEMILLLKVREEITNLITIGSNNKGIESNIFHIQILTNYYKKIMIRQWNICWTLPHLLTPSIRLTSRWVYTPYSSGYYINCSPQSLRTIKT